MTLFKRSQVQPIGLDLGNDGVKLLQVETVGQTLAVVAAARQQLPPEARSLPRAADRLKAGLEVARQLLRQGGFAGRDVVAALPREILHVKNLRLPMIPAHELAAAVQYEARNIFPFDTDHAHVGFLPAGEVRQGADARQEVVVIAARGDDVDAFLEQLHGIGAVVASLDVESCGVFRAFERFIRRREDEQEVHVLLDVGSRRSQVIIGKGRDISFLKPIDIGAQHFHDAVATKLGITADEARALRRRLTEDANAGGAGGGAVNGGGVGGGAADAGGADAGRRDPVRQAVFDATRSAMEDLGREAALCLRYYSVTFRGLRPAKLRLAGGGACDPHLQSVLAAALTIPVEAGRPLLGLDTARMKPADRNGTLCEWTLALGLGLRFAAGPFGPSADRVGPDGVRVRSSDAAVSRAPAVEVVDLDKAVEGAASAARASNFRGPQDADPVTASSRPRNGQPAANRGAMPAISARGEVADA